MTLVERYRHALLLTCVLGLEFGVGKVNAETVTVDLSALQSAVTYRSSGILLSVDAANPPDALIAPLKPRLFRDLPQVILADAPRMVGFGAQIQGSVSGAFGYPDTTAYWPGDGGDFGPWLTIIQKQVTAAKAQSIPFLWDIWNEPDGPTFWKRSTAQFNETWRQSVLQLRSLYPQAVIVGPSATGNDINYIEAFLLYAKANNVLPDIVSWHAFQGPAATAAEISTLRAFMTANGITIPRISINEYIFQPEQFHPGTLAQYLAVFERAQVDSAAHTCWTEPSAVSNCFNSSLDGLLTADTKQPRSTWWAEEAYASLTGNLISVTPSVNVDGIAAADPTLAQIQIVLGKNGGSSGIVDVFLTHLDHASYLLAGGQVHVVAQQIPDSDINPLPAPIKTIDANYDVTGNQVHVVLPQMGATDGYSIQVTALAAPTLEQAQIYPNPLRPSLGHTQMNFTGLPAGAHGRIYTLAGEKVGDFIADALGLAHWNGLNLAGQKAASGVYFVEIEGSGTKKTFKIAVQR